MQQEIDDGEQYEDFFYGMLQNDDNNHVLQLTQHEIIYDLNNPQKMIEEFFKNEEFAPSQQHQYIQRKTIYNNSQHSDDDDSLKEDLAEQDYEQKQTIVIPNLDITQKKAPKIQKKYQELSDIVHRINHVSWSDYTSTSIKQVPLKNMTPMSFWFMVCAQYFNKKQFLEADAVLSEVERQMQMIEVNFRIAIEGELDDQSQSVEFDEFYDFIRQHIPVKDPVEQEQRSLTLKLEYDNEDNIFIMAIRQKLMGLWSRIKHNERLSGMFQSNEPMPQMEEDDEVVEAEQEIIDKCEESTYFRWDKLLTFLQRIPLQDITALLSQDLESIYADNQSMMLQLRENIAQEVSATSKFIASLDSADKDEILIDIQGLTQIEKDYMNYLENRQQSGEHLKEIMQQKQNRTNLSGTARQLSNRIMGQDLVCQICNDGDYSDDNLIVFCARCNISIHQKCYGIETIPLDDWICDLCLKFGQQGRYLKCPMCTRRGGAMKPSNILMNSSVFEIINPSYHQYAHSTPKRPQVYEEECYPREHIMNQLYYDFQVVQNALDPEKIIEPISDRAWIHLTCAYWLPECFFTSNGKEKQSQIVGVQNIDKKRFNLTCHICKMRRSGACVQCSRGKCCIAFHPECARRAQLFMEPRPYPQSYLIYCDKHMPLKLKRVLENKAKVYVEEIHNFCRVLEKVEVILFDEKYTSGGNLSDKKRKIAMRAQQLEIDAEIKQENIQLIQALKDYLSSTVINKITVDLVEVKSQGSIGFRVDKIGLPLNAKSERNVMALEINDPVWSHFKYQSYSQEQIYKLYKRAIRMEKRTRPMKQRRQFLDLFDEELQVKRQRKSSSNSAVRKFKKVQKQKTLQMKKLLKKIKKQKSNRPRRDLTQNKIKIVIPLELRPLFKPEQEDTTLYCVCHQPFRVGEDMMQCELCQEWYHLKCLGFTQGIDQANEINFYCFQCERGVEKDRLRKVKQLYKHYFTDTTFKTLKNKALKQKNPDILEEKNITQKIPPQIEDQDRHFTRTHQKRNYKTMNVAERQQTKIKKQFPLKKQKESKQVDQPKYLKKIVPRMQPQQKVESTSMRKRRGGHQ